MIFRKPKPPLMVIIPPGFAPDVCERVQSYLDASRETSVDLVLQLHCPGVTILQCVNGEWIPLPLPTPDADEPPPRSRTLG